MRSALGLFDYRPDAIFTDESSFWMGLGAQAMGTVLAGAVA